MIYSDQLYPCTNNCLDVAFSDIINEYIDGSTLAFNYPRQLAITCEKTKLAVAILF